MRFRDRHKPRINGDIQSDGIKRKSAWALSLPGDQRTHYIHTRTWKLDRLVGKKKEREKKKKKKKMFEWPSGRSLIFQKYAPFWCFSLSAYWSLRPRRFEWLQKTLNSNAGLNGPLHKHNLTFTHTYPNQGTKSNSPWNTIFNYWALPSYRKPLPFL